MLTEFNKGTLRVELLYGKVSAVMYIFMEVNKLKKKQSANSNYLNQKPF